MSKRMYVGCKRVLDVAVSFGLLIVLLPALFVIGALIKASEPSSAVMFRQLRAGIHGKAFGLLKFRTMRTTTSATDSGVNGLDLSSWKAGVPDGFVYKSAKSAESRVTPLGHFLRTSSLDELPQLINVLRGEMSLVGPRPEVLPIVECYNAEQRRRLDVKPGMTGLAQVSGRSEQNHGEKIVADLRYVEHASFGMDIRILIKTVRVAAQRTGSY